MKPLETATVRNLRRIAASFVRGDRRANAHCYVITGRVEGGSLW